MITGIREKTVVRENGKIEIPFSDLPTGTEVEVIVLVNGENADEQDETEYLLSTEANRKYLEDALEELKHPENFIRVDIEDL